MYRRFGLGKRGLLRGNNLSWQIEWLCRKGMLTCCGRREASEGAEGPFILTPAPPDISRTGNSSKPRPNPSNLIRRVYFKRATLSLASTPLSCLSKTSFLPTMGRRGIKNLKGIVEYRKGFTATLSCR